MTSGPGFEAAEDRASPQRYRFGDFRVDGDVRELIGPDGAAIPLTGKAFDVLLYLVEHPQRIVGKDELLAQVWADRVVDENNLTQAISALRKALGASAGDHRYILTEARRGYRFVAEVRSDNAEIAPAPRAVAAERPAAVVFSTRTRRVVIGGALLVASSVPAMMIWRGRESLSLVAQDTARAPALAVLPFRTIAGASRDELLELGLAETLIARLSASGSVRVRSLASARRFAATEQDPLAAGRALGATYVLEGATQWHGGQLRVTARLLAVATGETAWAGMFDARPDQVFTLQDDMAEAVGKALSLTLNPLPTGRSACDGADADAYRAYLRGRTLVGAPSAERIGQAVLAFRQAIDLDPTCARAYAGLSWAYRGLVMTGDRAPREVFPLAEAAVERALALDPSSAEALTGKGFLQYWYRWDWAGAEASLRRAIAQNPSLADAHFAYAHLLTNTGRFDEGLQHSAQARELDPLSPMINTADAMFHSVAGRARDAQVLMERAMDMAPDFWIAWLGRGGLALGRGDGRAAIADLERSAALSGGNSQALALLGIAYAAAGERARAEEVLHRLEASGRAGYVPASCLASVRNALGDTSAALDLLERAYTERDVRMVYLKVDARWNNLRTEPRFRALAQRLGLSADRASGYY